MQLFRDLARNVTPLDLRSSLQILYLPAISDSSHIDQCRTLLAPDELKHADSISTEHASQHFIVRRAFQRYCASKALGADIPANQIPFAHTKTGQPMLADHLDISISFSACAVGYLGAWSRWFGIGVDIEDLNRTVEPVALAKRYFATSEADFITRANDKDCHTAFLTLWTLKEAVLKSVGKGLAFGLDRFAFALDPEIALIKAPAEFGGPDAFRFAMIPNTEGLAALTYHTPKSKQ